jgi:multiple antibiotic resistance protein
MYYSIINTFLLLFVTMGPIKVLIVFAEMTSEVDSANRRNIALKAVGIAAVVGVIFIVFGQFLMALFKFSLEALSIAGGIILFIFAINMVLSDSPGHGHGKPSQDEIDRMASYPLAMPLMASPMGIVYLTIASATAQALDERMIGITIVFLVIMAINLGALLLVDRISKFISLQALQISERVLGILLAALAIETIINGLRDVLPKILGG